MLNREAAYALFLLHPLLKFVNGICGTSYRFLLPSNDDCMLLSHLLLQIYLYKKRQGKKQADVIVLSLFEAYLYSILLSIAI